MHYKIEYITYNNFKATTFCKSLYEAENVAVKLKEFKHVSKVEIIAQKGE
jgi:hypothetical protein